MIMCIIVLFNAAHLINFVILGGKLERGNSELHFNGQQVCFSHESELSFHIDMW